jgi:hypothetical protein
MSSLKYGLYKWKLPELGNLTGYALDYWGGHSVHAAVLEFDYYSYSSSPGIYKLKHIPASLPLFLIDNMKRQSFMAVRIYCTAQTLYIKQLQNGKVTDVSETQ